MSHELYENDQMFSVNEVPWHGLGNIIDHVPTIEEAIIASGLEWNVSSKKMFINDDNDNLIQVPAQNALVRNDTLQVLGVVGDRYEIYQNSDMWQFIDVFQKETGIHLETAGSLRNGRTTWVLAKNDKEILEVVKNDPIEEYFLFRNSFDGSTPISLMFTNIRVVCNNTLTSALKGANNIFNVRHTKSSGDQLKEVHKALKAQYKFKVKFIEGLETLSRFQMGDTDINNFLENTLFPLKAQNIQDIDDTTKNIIDISEMKGRGITVRNNKIEAIRELIAAGAGTDIPGVYGTAYGVYQAVTEWADHNKTVRLVGDRDEKEAKFENAFYGSGSQFKANAFNELLKIAA